MSTTLWNIIDEVYRLLGQKNTSTVFSRSVLVKKINSINRNICKGFYTSIWWISKRGAVNWPTFRCGYIPFMEWKKLFRNNSPSVLSSSFSLTATTLSCGTATLMSAWFVIIWWDIFSYTWKTDTTLTGVVWWEITHEAWEIVRQLYYLPTDIDKIETLKKEKYNIPLDETESLGIYYNIVWNNLIKIIGLVNNDIITLTYTKKLTDLVNDWDTCILPDDYGIRVLANLSAGELWMEKTLPNANSHLQNWIACLQTMYWDFSQKIKLNSQKLHPISYRNIW